MDDAELNSAFSCCSDVDGAHAQPEKCGQSVGTT